MISVRAKEMIKQARRARGLTDIEVAAKLQISVHEFYDLEQHSDEITSAVPLSLVRALCDLLGLALSNVLIAEGVLSTGKASESARFESEVGARALSAGRVAKQLSLDDVASAIGFDVSAIGVGEVSDAYLESLPIRVLVDWAKFVGAPIDNVLRIT
jgi:transcriptional regulator with XRE-family HTH domain